MGINICQFRKSKYELVGLFILFLAVVLISTSDQVNHSQTTIIDQSEFSTRISKVQIPFIVNEGQYNEDVKFYAKTFSGMVFITKNGEIVYSLPMYGKYKITTGIAIKENFTGGKTNNITGQEQSLTKVSYIKGVDRLKWSKNVSTYNSIDFDEVYDGIEVKLKAYGNNVEKLFIVKPGANPENIKVELNNVTKLEINEAGELEIKTELGSISFTKPIAYQEEAGQKIYVNAEYLVKGKKYGFTIGDYDTEKNLVIDPLLASTFIGGNSTDDDYEPSIVLDHIGNVYITGYTYSTDFPTTLGVYDESFGGSTDRFVSKFDSDLENLLVSTFIGGNGDENGMGMQITVEGYVYLAGYTTSSDFPTTPGAYDQIHNGGRDAFILKLDEDLTSLLASTFLGGSGDEGYQWPRIDIVIDEISNVYVTGLTKSQNFPISSGAYDNNFAGGLTGGDAFVSKFDSNLTSLLGSTYIGGNMDEWRVSVALDESNNIYICGETSSSTFPTTQNAYDPSFNGGSDIFISKFSNNLTSLLSSTFLGANSYEEALALKLNNNGEVYLTGYTMSSNFPVTANANNTNYNGGERDAYIAKFNNNLSSLLASTFIGGDEKDTGEDIVIDDFGNIYLTGVTLSSDFPSTSGAYDESFNGGEDIFISKLDANLASILASTFFGRSRQEKGQCIALDDRANVYIAGSTTSINFPVTPNAYNSSYNGGNNDCFIIKFDSSLSRVSTSMDERKGPGEFELFNNYPNPFQHYTTISYNVEQQTMMVLKINDLLGKEVKTLIDGIQEPGKHSVVWDARDNYGAYVNSGIYNYSIQTIFPDKSFYTKKLSLIK